MSTVNKSSGPKRDTKFVMLFMSSILVMVLLAIPISFSASAQEQDTPTITATDASLTDTPAMPTATPSPTETEDLSTSTPDQVENQGTETDTPETIQDTPVPTGMPDGADQPFAIKALSQTSGCNGSTCVFQVRSSSDDAGVNPLSCSYATNFNEIYFGFCSNSNTPIVSGFRFTNITIPKGTQIAQAYLEFTVDGPYTDPITVNFYGEAAGNSLTFSSLNRPSDRRLTSDYATWSIPSTDRWDLGQIRDTPDLTKIVQAIINRSDWSSGNALSIIARTMTAGGTNRHRRVIGYDRPIWYPGSQYAAKLVIRLGYDCTNAQSSLSRFGQVVLATTKKQNFCLNNYDGLTIIPSGNPPSGSSAFHQFADLTRTARYEVDFTNMIWDSGSNTPGKIFLQGVKDLYTNVKNHPESYPEGMRIRILLGLEHYLSTVDQRAIVLSDMAGLGIPLEDSAINWKVEVAAYRDSSPVPFLGYISNDIHSHAKILIVDGQSAFAVGYNMQNMYLNKQDNPQKGSDNPTIDAGIELSGPIVQDTLKVYDGLWAAARGLKSCSSPNGYCEYLTEAAGQIPHAPEVFVIHPGFGTNTVNAFSLFRDHTDKTADLAITSAISLASKNVNLLENRYFENFPPDRLCIGDYCIIAYRPPSIPPGEVGPMQYSPAVIHALQNGAKVRILVSGDLGEMLYSGAGLYNLQEQILAQTNSADLLNNLDVRFANGLLHAKALSIDGQFMVVGSQNFDFSAFGSDATASDLAEYNFGVDNAAAASGFDTQYESLWENSKGFAVSGPDLQATIDQAPAGAIVYVPAGTYATTLTIDKPLSLIGVSADKSIIDAGGTTQPGIKITSSNVNVANLTVSGSQNYGISLVDVSSSSLKNVNIKNVLLEKNTLGGISIIGLIPGSPIKYLLENDTFVGGQTGVALNLLQYQANASLIHDNLFINQSIAPIRILSAYDGHVEYSYNLFSLCGINSSCDSTWYQGSLDPASTVHDNLFDLDPMFIDPANADYRLSPTSPLIDAGDPAVTDPLVTDGNGDGLAIADIGAFESLFTQADLTSMPTDDAPDYPGLIATSSPSNTNLRLLINGVTDKDWFRFTLSTAGDIQVHLESLPANYDVYLYNAAGQLLGSSTKAKKAAELIKLDNARPGTYYVLVEGVEGAWDATNTYQLRINVP